MGNALLAAVNCLTYSTLVTDLPLYVWTGGGGGGGGGQFDELCRGLWRERKGSGK